MWHRKRRARLGVKTKHRKALLRNLVRGLAIHREIVTTLARAHEASRLADQMVTLAKEGTLTARRRIISRLGSPDVAHIFISEIAPRLNDRKGGYTRVLKLNDRHGDGATTALLQFSVPIEIETKGTKPKKEKKPKAAKPAVEEKPVKPEKPAKVEKEKPAKVEKPSAKPAEKKEKEKPETEKRGGFLSKLRKFLTGDENK